MFWGERFASGSVMMESCHGDPCGNWKEDLQQILWDGHTLEKGVSRSCHRSGLRS